MIFHFSKTSLTCFLALCTLSLCCYCTKEDFKNQITKQEKDIDDFISKDTANAIRINKDTIITVTHKKETNRIVWNPQTGDTLAPGDTVLFAYIGSIFTSSGKGREFATNLIDDSPQPSLYPQDFGKNVVGTGYYIRGLDAGLVGMRAGEYAYIIFTSQYGYGNKELSTIPKMSPLMFKVEIQHIVKKK